MQAIPEYQSSPEQRSVLIASTISTIDFDSLADEHESSRISQTLYAPQIQTSNQKDSSKLASRRVIGGQHDWKTKDRQISSSGIREAWRHLQYCSTLRIAGMCQWMQTDTTWY